MLKVVQGWCQNKNLRLIADRGIYCWRSCAVYPAPRRNSRPIFSTTDRVQTRSDPRMETISTICSESRDRLWKLSRRDVPKAAPVCGKYLDRVFRTPHPSMENISTRCSESRTRLWKISRRDVPKAAPVYAKYLDEMFRKPRPSMENISTRCSESRHVCCLCSSHVGGFRL